MFKKNILLTITAVICMLVAPLALSLNFTVAKAENNVTKDQSKKISVKLKKVNFDGSEDYIVQGKEIKVTKKSIEIVKNELKSISNSKDLELGTSSALPYFGSIAAMVSWIQYQIGYWSFQAFIFLTRACSGNIQGCVNMVIGMANGAGWAWNQARNWASGR
jgi:hypothetical protein